MRQSAVILACVCAPGSLIGDSGGVLPDQDAPALIEVAVRPADVAEGNISRGPRPQIMANVVPPGKACDLPALIIRETECGAAVACEELDLEPNRPREEAAVALGNQVLVAQLVHETSSSIRSHLYASESSVASEIMTVYVAPGRPLVGMTAHIRRRRVRPPPTGPAFAQSACAVPADTSRFVTRRSAERTIKPVLDSASVAVDDEVPEAVIGHVQSDGTRLPETAVILVFPSSRYAW
jgi:hypothetical protein